MTLIGFLVCAASYIGATGRIERINTIPVRAASTGLLLVSLGLLVTAAAIDLATFF